MQLLDRYEEVVGHQEVQRLRQLAAFLTGKRIVHVNSTATGGGVAEILGWMVPLMNELGLDARWEVIQGPPEFYQVTKAFHNGLQGLPVALKPKDFELHYEVNRENAQRLNLQADVVLVHDPQPVYLPRFTPPGQVRCWLWRCHIDASRPDRSVWRHVEGAIPDYHATIFSMAAFTRPLPRPMYIIPPSIDPLSEKNCPIPESERLEEGPSAGHPLAERSKRQRATDALGLPGRARAVQHEVALAGVVERGGRLHGHRVVVGLPAVDGVAHHQSVLEAGGLDRSRHLGERGR